MPRAFSRLAIVLMALCLPAFSQGTLTINGTQTWGGAGADNGNAVAVDSSGNTYVAGSTSSFGAGGQDVVLLKYSLSGSLLWQKTWGGSGDDVAYGVLAGPDGSVYVVGGTDSFGAGWYDVLILKFDSSGNLQWARTWGGGSFDQGYDVSLDGNGNLAIAAESYSFGNAVVLLTVSTSGNFISATTWKGPATYDSGYSITMDANGNKIITGTSWDYSVSPYHNTILILKFDSAGNLLWNRNWAGPSEDETSGRKVVRTDSDGNIYILGHTSPSCTTGNFSQCVFNLLLLKISPDGNLLWSRQWGENSFITPGGFWIDGNGQLEVTGSITAPIGGAQSALIQQYDGSGNVLASQELGMAGSGLNSLTANDSGTLIAAGIGPNNTGTWSETGIDSVTAPGSLTSPSYTIASQTGSFGTPNTPALSPNGIQNSGGGGADVLVTWFTASGTTGTKQGSSVLLNSSNPSAPENSPVTFTATVTPASSGTPTGTVSFFDGSTQIGTAPLTNETAVYTTSALGLGTHSITAHYSGDGNFTGSVSDALTQMVTVAPPPTITSFTPTQGMPGEQIYGFVVVGTNFQPGATVSFSGGQSVVVDSGFVSISPTVIHGSLSISPTAAIGMYTVTVTNPDMQAASLTSALDIQTIPPTPTHLMATVGNQTVDLQWDPSQASIQAFNVYVDRIDGTTPISLGLLASVTPQTTTLHVSELPDGSIAQNGQLYRFRVTAAGNAGESDPATVYAEPNEFAFTSPPHPLHPILFLHGIDSDASTWNVTTDFLSHTLGWQSGGILSYCPSRYSDPSAYCDTELSTFAHPADYDPSTQAGVPPSIQSIADFFTADFGDNLANTRANTANPSDGITYQGDEVGGFVNFIQSVRVPNTKISIVAHSMGGLAARSYIQSSAGIASAQISDLVTYGTPHNGVDQAYLQNIGNLAYLLNLADYLNVLTSRGLADMNSGCYANGATSDFARVSQFMQSVDNPDYVGFAPLPSSLRYFLIYGTGWPYLDTCNPSGSSSDLLVPVTSANPSGLPTSGTWQSLETPKYHTEMTSDYPSILCALAPSCLIYRVLSPVTLTITSPGEQSISSNSTSIPGAEYMNIMEENGHETATILIPFPVGGQYTVTAVPKPGALPTDTFTILQIQNGVTTTLASNMPISNIPAAGFQTQVKSGTSYSVTFGGSVQQPLTNDGNGHLVAIVTVTNQGNVTVDTTQINLAGTTLGTTAATSISSPVSNLAPGASAVFTLSFPSTAVSPAAKSAPLKISGTYSAGTLSGNWTLTFRSVTLPSGGPDL